MNTIEALKLIRTIESAFQKAASTYGGDKTAAFLNEIHGAGFVISRDPDHVPVVEADALLAVA